MARGGDQGPRSAEGAHIPDPEWTEAMMRKINDGSVKRVCLWSSEDVGGERERLTQGAETEEPGPSNKDPNKEEQQEE